MKINNFEKAKEMIESSKLKSRFIANMSHELRTPLNSIIGFSELLKEKLVGELNEKQEYYLTIILNSGKNLLKLLENILTLSKFEAELMEFESEPLDIKKILWKIIEKYKLEAEKKKLQIKATLEETLPTIMSDKEKLSLIFDNLINNAVKFTEKGSISIIAKSKEDKLWVEIEDTGIGISESDIPHIFTEFHQFEFSSTREYPRTGLGLAITKRCVEFLNGEIDVESKLGRGTKFTVKLPIKKYEIPIEEKIISPEKPFIDKPILVVEDDVATQKLMADWLVHAGYKVVIASTGKEAIEKAMRLKPGLITLDILLPDMDGWRLLYRLKTNEKTREIPVIITSIVDDKNFAIELGAVDYLVKPFSRTQLLERIEAAISKKEEKPIKVLIIDANPQDVLFIEEVLRVSGFMVEKAYSAVTGIKKIRSIKPDLIILDLAMPDLNGFDVMKLIETDKTIGEKPILIFTSKELTPEERKKLSKNVKGILEKTKIDKETLRKEIENTIKKYVSS